MDSNNSNKAFYELIWPHAPAVLRMALFLTHNHAEAEDMAQETMLKAFKALDRFQPGTDAPAWLIAILRNTWLDRVRSLKSRRETQYHDDELQHLSAAQIPPTDDWTDAEDILQQFSDNEIIAALAQLPDEIRWTLLLVDVQGIDQHTAATLLDVPLGTIKSRAHRGRAMLRDVLLPKARDLGFLPRAVKVNPGTTSEVKP